MGNSNVVEHAGDVVETYSKEELLKEVLRLSEENQKLKDQRTMLQRELLKNH